MLLIDQSQETPEYVGKIPVFLPSDLSLGRGRWQDHRFVPRMASIYAYDENLFRDRFLGPPGAP